MAKVLNKFLIGCDPEFAGLSSAGNLINFSRHGIPHDGPVGYDHDGWVCEIRPEPALGTYTVVKRLQALIKGLPAMTGVAKLRAGAHVKGSAERQRGVTLGGHVHLDLSPFGQGIKKGRYGVEYDNSGLRRTPCPEHLTRVKALDKITAYLEALDILPTNESLSRRGAGQGYGHWGDVRIDNGRTEYRTMASWLDKPTSAMICMTAAKLAASEPTTVEFVATKAAFPTLVEWFERFKSADINARRVTEKILSMGHKGLVASPDDDFREKWGSLGF